MHQHEREASRLAWNGSHLRRWWSRLGWTGAIALGLGLPSMAVAATGDSQDRPANITHNQANPATASDPAQTAWDLMVDRHDRSSERESAHANYQPASNPPVGDPADHSYAQGRFQLGAGHQD